MFPDVYCFDCFELLLSTASYPVNRQSGSRRGNADLRLAGNRRANYSAATKRPFRQPGARQSRV